MRNKNSLLKILAGPLIAFQSTCVPIPITPTLPNDILSGETMDIYEEDLKVNYNNRLQINHVYPALTNIIARPVIIPSLDRDTAGDLWGSASFFNELLRQASLPEIPEAPFSVRYVNRNTNDAPNIPFLYSEQDILFEDTNYDYFTTDGSSFTVWLPFQNNLTPNPLNVIRVRYHPKSHSPRYLTEHQNPNPDPQDLYNRSFASINPDMPGADMPQSGNSYIVEGQNKARLYLDKNLENLVGGPTNGIVKNLGGAGSCYNFSNVGGITRTGEVQKTVNNITSTYAAYEFNFDVTKTPICQGTGFFEVNFPLNGFAQTINDSETTQ